MRRPVAGEVHVHYGQIYVESDPDSVIPDLSEAFAGQSGGLCGAAVPGVLWLVTGLHTGNVGFVVEVHDEDPPLDPIWEDVVEVSFRPVSDRTSLVQWAGEAAWDLNLARTDYRVRYCARRMDEGRQLDTRVSGEPQADNYLLQFWPGQPGADRVVRQTSRNAAYWHRNARELPLPPTPEQRAETERLVRQAEERAAEERRLHYERWMWGGRLPSEGLRGVGGNVRGLLRFDSDLVHALDTAGSEAQRAVALLAARRACEAAGLMSLPWVTQAHTALTEKRPLPPPFDDLDQMWETLRSDPQLPSRSVLQAVPPERPPYRPLTPRAAAEWTRLPAVELGDSGRRRSLGRVLGALIPSVPAGDSPTPTGAMGHGVAVHTSGTVRGPQQIAQPYFALPAVLAAAEHDPLKAALDAVWHAVNTYGEHYPGLLEELRSVCADQVEE
ncbi:MULTISPECIES: hypothetical protein [Streptomyces]|uniref:hypothetical protein n=1 Tax=Streptomyces TaxID=1883 RepID=UPI0004CC84FF|nr:MULTISPECIES: hypothetical protein [Streptomyces]WSF81614.1 hypothetical protein OG838_36250 [Streptomyces globisporus]WSQ96541.1 hypothetical protein OG425_34635 [Streptomyces globisporus]